MVRKLTPALEEDVATDYSAKGLAVKDICKKYRLSPPTVYYILGKRGITIRRGARGVAGMMAKVFKNRLTIGRAVAESLGLKEGSKFKVEIVSKRPVQLRLEELE